jgi:choline dehydrogenase-like flavoprotein
MHTSPKFGVVDPNCRVHDVDNLYLAGSSVFPAFGYANPTFTIVALALRLVDHLRPKLAAPSLTTAPDGGDTA